MWFLKYVGSAALFFGLGHAPTLYIGDPRLGIAASVAGIIPYGSTARSYMTALVRGAVLGLIAGLSIGSALKIRFAKATNGTVAVYVAATVLMCAAAAGLFFHMARRRRKLIDRQWQ